MSSRNYDSTKRAIDLVGALYGLFLLAPLLVFVAVAIVIDSRGPVFFRQVRSGLNGRSFVIYKFRTMLPDSDTVDKPLAETDPAITRVGRFLRSTSIDELPQLINVVRGEMSLVGPRPTIPEQVEKYDEFQRRRLEVRPGLTGWAQVNGRNSLDWDRRIELDVWYVDNRSLELDAQIVQQTLQVLAKPALNWSPEADEEVPREAVER
jgi:undecaprenyl phosphate N,N'-diacetylbacillosamine 1-phosphate transferase